MGFWVWDCRIVPGSVQDKEEPPFEFVLGWVSHMPPSFVEPIEVLYQRVWDVAGFL